MFNDRGSIAIQARVSGRVRPGVAAVPSGWWSLLGPDGQAANQIWARPRTPQGGVQGRQTTPILTLLSALSLLAVREPHLVDGLVLPVAPWQHRPVRQGPLSTVPEYDFAGLGPLAAEAPFMHEAVVLAAKMHEVVQAGLAALTPVLDVMGVDEMLSVAAGKTASVVSQP